MEGTLAVIILSVAVAAQAKDKPFDVVERAPRPRYRREGCRHDGEARPGRDVRVEDTNHPFWRSAQVGAFDSTNAPTVVPDLGDEAFYAEFKNDYGSNLLVHRGSVILTFSGNQRRDAYVAMAKVVLGRM
jgi:hypothetical protein